MNTDTIQENLDTFDDTVNGDTFDETVNGIKKRITLSPDELDLKFVDLDTKLTDIINIFRNTNKCTGIRSLRSIHKQICVLRKQTKNTIKNLRKRKPSTVPRTINNGFCKPYKISEELALFMGKSIEETVSRVDVTKFVCKYIKDNNLQNVNDRRLIIVDDKLSTIINLQESIPLTFYNLQIYLKKHFVSLKNDI